MVGVGVNRRTHPGSSSRQQRMNRFSHHLDIIDRVQGSDAGMSSKRTNSVAFCAIGDNGSVPVPIPHPYARPLIHQSESSESAAQYLTPFPKKKTPRKKERPASIFEPSVIVADRRYVMARE